MKALFAGSFDPFTIGHRDIVTRGLCLFDEIIIGVGYNEHKPGDRCVEQRVAFIEDIYEGDPRVSVGQYTGLTVDFAKSAGADVLLRSVRNITDFEYERNLADINREIAGIDTVLLFCDPRWQFVSSSMVRELMHNGHDISKYIPGKQATDNLE